MNKINYAECQFLNYCAFLIGLMVVLNEANFIDNTFFMGRHFNKCFKHGLLVGDEGL